MGEGRILVLGIAVFAVLLLVPITSFAAPPENNPGNPFEEIVALLNQLQIDVDNIISLLTDSIFGLEEIKKETAIIDAKMDVIDAKVDEINDKVDALGNSGMKRMEISMPKRFGGPLGNIPLGANVWKIELKCPDNSDCGPMTVDILHFKKGLLDAGELITPDPLVAICVDDFPCTLPFDNNVSLGLVGTLSSQVPYFPILYKGNVFVLSAHGPVQADTVEVQKQNRWFGDVTFGVLVPEGATIEKSSDFRLLLNPFPLNSNAVASQIETQSDSVSGFEDAETGTSSDSSVN